MLVLAHGFGTDQSVWARYLPWLSTRYRVVTYDLAGAPSSDPAYFEIGRHGTLDGHARDMLEVLRTLAVRRCTVVGHSMAGIVSVLAAIEQPELFERLILIAPSARYLDDGDYVGGFDESNIRALLTAIQTRFREWATSFAPMMLERPVGDPAAETFAASLQRMRPDIVVAMAKAILFSDYRSALADCAVPATILQPSHDPAVPLEAARYVNEHLKGSVMEVIEAAGHLPHLSAPEVMECALRRHLPRFSADPAAASAG